MAFKRVNEVTGRSVPEFAGTIITACQELIPVLVETAVGKGEDVAFQFLDQSKLLLFFVLNFLDEFYDYVKGYF